MRVFPYVLILLSLNAFAEGVQPSAPAGWVEIDSVGPIILTWVKGDVDKKLKEVPTLMVQQFPRTEKFVKFVQEKKLDEKSCRELVQKEWKQTWCLRSESVMVLLAKNEDSELHVQKKKLLEWVLTHD